MALGFAIPLATIVIFYAVKANAAILFFIVCACALLFDRGTDGLETMLGTVAPNAQQAADYVVPALLLLPLMIGLLLLSRHGKKWLMVQLLAAAATGLVLYLLAVRVVLYLYDVDWRSGAVWQIFSAHEDLLVALGIFGCLIAMPFGGKGGGHEGKHAKH